MVKQAQTTKSRTQGLADKAARWLTIIALVAGGTTFAVWLAAGPDLAFAVERMATVMVITCPHALGLAIPLVSAVSTTLSAKHGLLIRNKTAFENARKITAAVFDKTGTLTKASFGVRSVNLISQEYNKRQIIQLAASLENNSQHPIAKAITTKAKDDGLDLLEVADFKPLKGEGVQGKVDNNLVKLVSKKYLQNRDIETKDQDQEGTLVYVLADETPVAFFVLADDVRPQSYEAVARLQKKGIKCWLLTGDNQQAAQEVAQALHLDGFFAQVLPDEKQQKIRQLQEQGEFVAMIGDGINDAPALAQADVGIAIGSGTDIAAETADIILVESNPLDVSTLITFGQATYGKMVQNLFWATAYNALAIPLAAGVLYGYGILVSPALGAALMSLSTVIVAINAKLLRLKK
jgi:Cu2+-exporting ATPase